MAGSEPVNRSQAPAVKFTYDDCVNFPDDGKRHEIIDGEHYVTPSPNTKHQVIVGNLYLGLSLHARQHALGAVFVAPFDVVFSNLDVVEPDLLYVSRARLEILTKAHVRGSPDLVVEVLSPGTRRTDEITKRKLYERFDVQEYWIIDPELDTIKVYTRSKGRFERTAELSLEDDDALSTGLLPGWSMRLRDVFEVPFTLPEEPLQD